MAICEHCGKEFQAKRVTAKFCSDVCRVREHRVKKESPINDRIVAIAEMIREIGSYTDGELSFQAIQALKSIKALAGFQDIANKSSWWRCSNCCQAVQKELPKDGDCSCGKTQNANWRLQKTMI